MSAAETSTVDEPKSARSLTVQTFWFAVAKTIAFVLTSIVPLLLVRLLDQTELGLYKQAFLVIASAQRILTLGFGLSAFYFFPRMRGAEKPYAANIIAFNTGIGVVAWAVFALYPPLLGRLFGRPDLISYAPLIGAVIFLWIFSSFLEIAPAALQETKTSTVLIVVMQLSRMVFMVAATLWSASLDALLWSAVAQGILQSCVLLKYLNKRFPGFLRCFSATAFRIQFGYILPLTVAYFIGVLQADAPQYLVANHYGPALYAIFTIGTFQLPLINILHESVGVVLIPTVSRLHHEGREKEIVLILAAAMRKTAAIAFPIYFGLLVVAHEFIVVLYTNAYAASAPIFAVNLALLPLTVLIYDPLIRSFEQARSMLVWIRVILLVLLVLAVWIGVRQGSMTAPIYAVVLAAATERLAICWRMAHLLGLGWRDRHLFADIGKITLSSAIGGLVIWCLRPFLIPYGPIVVLVVCGAVFIAVYMTGILWLKVPSSEEREIASRFLRRLRASAV